MLPAERGPDQEGSVDFGAAQALADANVEIDPVRGRVDQSEHREMPVPAGQERIVARGVGSNTRLAHQAQVVVQRVAEARLIPPQVRMVNLRVRRPFVARVHVRDAGLQHPWFRLAREDEAALPRKPFRFRGVGFHHPSAGSAISSSCHWPAR